MKQIPHINKGDKKNIVYNLGTWSVDAPYYYPPAQPVTMKTLDGLVAKWAKKIKLPQIGLIPVQVGPAAEQPFIIQDDIDDAFDDDDLDDFGDGFGNEEPEAEEAFIANGPQPVINWIIHGGGNVPE